MSTDRNLPNTTATFGYPAWVVSRSVRLPHHGTRTGASNNPEAIRMGRCARRWKSTVTSLAVMFPVADIPPTSEVLIN